GRLMRPVQFPGRQQAEATGFTHKPGTGPLIAEVEGKAENSGLVSDLKQLAAQNNITLQTDSSAPLLPRGGYMPQPKLPERTVHLAIATAWPSTPAEYIDSHDLIILVQLLSRYLQGSAVEIQPPAVTTLNEPALPPRPTSAPADAAILKHMIETYGVSSHEGNGKGPGIAVVAHQDEIGYEVHSILPDGALELISKGGGVPAYFLGHPALVHS